MPTIPETMESLLKELTAKQELSQKLLDELRALKEGPTFHNQLRALELHEQLLHLEAERIGIKERHMALKDEFMKHEQELRKKSEDLKATIGQAGLPSQTMEVWKGLAEQQGSRGRGEESKSAEKSENAVEVDIPLAKVEEEEGQQMGT